MKQLFEYGCLGPFYYKRAAIRQLAWLPRGKDPVILVVEGMDKPKQGIAPPDFKTNRGHYTEWRFDNENAS